jgi:UDP-glucose 4-epimerase
MNKILVSGGAGYIGSFMVRHLAESGFEPVIVDNLVSGHKEAVKGFKLIELDLAKEKEKLQELFKEEKFNGVIHMASYIQMGESFRNPSKYFENNLIAAINVLNAMAQNNVSNFILSSSAGVYGNPVHLPIEESDPKNPLNPYGETKYIIERMLPWYDKAHALKYMCIRYFNAAGAALDGEIGEDHSEESHLIPLAMKAALSGKEFTVFGKDYKTPDGTCVRDYIHVLDLVKAHSLALKALLSGTESNYFNAGVGKGYSNKEIVDMIEKVTGKKIKLTYGERRQGDADSLFAANAKIKKELSWEPKYGLKEIIQSAYKWHSSHPEGYK